MKYLLEVFARGLAQAQSDYFMELIQISVLIWIHGRSL